MTRYIIHCGKFHYDKNFDNLTEAKNYVENEDSLSPYGIQREYNKCLNDPNVFDIIPPRWYYDKKSRKYNYRLKYKVKQKEGFYRVQSGALSCIKEFIFDK